MDTNLVDIYYMADEFCKKIETVIREHKLPADSDRKTRKRSFTMSESEIITIMIYFHQSHCRDIKFFYVNHIKNHCREDFPQTVSYNRFVELQARVLQPLVVFLQVCCLGNCTGISFMDSYTCLPH